MRNFLKNNIFGFILGIVVMGSIGYVIASTIIDSKNVSYKETTVSDALDEMLGKLESNYCPKGYDCEGKKYTVNFVLNDGSTLSENSKEVTYNQLYGELATSEKSGYSLAWYLDEDYTQRVTEETTVKITDDTNLYGKWVVSLYNKVEEQVDTSKKSNDFNCLQPAGEDNGPTGVYEYNGEQDSDGGSKPIYFYRGLVENNNVLFAGYCWQIIRTTSTGGVKMIYNGVPDDGKCNGTTKNIGRSKFNNVIDEDKFYHSFYTYNENNYRGTGTDSTVKHFIEQEWYPTSNLNNQIYENMMEDTPYCMDRRAKYDNTYYDYPTAPDEDKLYIFGVAIRDDSGYITLGCMEEDLLSVKNTILGKKIGLINGDEILFAGDINSPSVVQFTYLGSRKVMGTWSMSPGWFSYSTSKSKFLAHTVVLDYNHYSDNTSGGYNNVRPTISILNSIEVAGGNGTSDNPYTLVS